MNFKYPPIKIGEKRSSKYGEYIIISQDQNDKLYYYIKFIKTGFIKRVRADAIRSGKAKDPYYPIIYGVACLGIVESTYDGKYCTKEYNTWHGMIARCYDINASNYPIYGGKGVKVCDRWLCFEYFLEDIPELPGYYEWKNSNDYNLDKDILQENIPYELRVYSKETCMFIPGYINRQRAKIDNKPKTLNNYFGVYKEKGKYRASIEVNKTKISLGTFTNEIAAVNAYNYFASKYNCGIMNDNIEYMPVEIWSEYRADRSKHVMCKIVNK